MLIQARSPVVVVRARPVEGTRLPRERAEALAQGHRAVVSLATVAIRVTGEVAAVRNRAVARVASHIVVAHASPGGALEGRSAPWQAVGRRVA